MKGPFQPAGGSIGFERRERRATRPGGLSRPGVLLLGVVAGVLAGAAAAVFIIDGADRDTREAGGRPGRSSPLPAAPAPPPTGGYASIVRDVMPSVVNISSVQVVRTLEHVSPFAADPFFRRFFGDRFYDFIVPRERRSLSLGSGVIVDENGTTLTNYHVVESSGGVRVTLSDGTELTAEILGTDERTDLAVLRLNEADLPVAPLGDSDALQVGDVVLAIGNPFGIGQTVTMGIVSAIGRGNIGVADYEDFIQTDAAINPGNSGGALINTRGEIVGINTAILSRSGGYQGIGFAIPSNMARDVLEDILKHGRVARGYAGLSVQPIHRDIARAFGLPDTRGALVAALDPSGPAARAGLRRGDVIVSVSGRQIDTAEDLRTRLSRLRPGDAVQLVLVRERRRFEIEMTLTEPPTPRPETRRPRR